MSWFDIAELVSIGLTIPAIVLAGYVVVLWGPDAWRIVKTHRLRLSEAGEATDWFILGVAAGFLGQALDNLFWQVAWNVAYLELDSQPVVFQVGVVFNIFFRQALGIIAAYCHIRSFAHHKKRSIRALSLVSIASVVLGCTNMIVIYLVKH